VFPIRPARGAAGRDLALLAQAEAVSGVAWVRFEVAEELVAHGTHIRDAGHGIVFELPLHREVPGLGIGCMVSCQKPGELEMGLKSEQSMVLSGCCAATHCGEGSAAGSVALR